MSEQVSRVLVSQLRDWGTTVVVEEAEVAAEAAGGWAVVAMEAAALTHLDLTVMSGRFSYRPTLPFTPGTAGVGRVLSGDPAVRGRRVLIRGAGVGLELPGTWAQRVTVPTSALRVIPERVDAALAATCYSPMTTAWAAAGPVGDIKPGQRVLVTGAAGGVGSMTVQLAARAGAHVIALVRNEADAAAVPPAAAEILTGGADLAARLREHGGVDVVLDTVGGDTVPTVLPAIEPGGRVVMIGYVGGKTLTVDLPTLLAADVALLPMNMVRRHVPDDVFDTLLTELGAGTLTLQTNTYPFTGINEALAARTSGSIKGTLALIM
ncbi:zinc-binding alcohol dehydrogenase family protein [Nocardia yunnanensis]|uniref:Zinc-binding alcohol dehydrogenase family protein n=1 Tax=Nocardia yunnanensis TaxID=2382165 RepID=A0A386ZMQ5_9NOCA|nr:zinc-binding alcohol dehydrogenase family protein [Nocardia yunnanensis]